MVLVVMMVLMVLAGSNNGNHLESLMEVNLRL